MFSSATTVLGWPELALGLIFLLLVANAARRGFLREGSLLLGLGFAIWSAGRLYLALSGALLPGAREGFWEVIVYVGLVLILLILAAGLSALAAPLIRRGPLRTLDHLAGLLVGIVEATLLVGLLAMAGQRVGALQLPGGGPAARSVELAALVLGWLAGTIPNEVLALAGLR